MAVNFESQRLQPLALSLYQYKQKAQPKRLGCAFCSRPNLLNGQDLGQFRLLILTFVKNSGRSSVIL